MNIWIIPHLFALIMFWMTLITSFTDEDLKRFGVLHRFIAIAIVTIGAWLIPASFILLIEVMK